MAIVSIYPNNLYDDVKIGNIYIKEEKAYIYTVIDDRYMLVCLDTGTIILFKTTNIKSCLEENGYRILIGSLQIQQ